MEAPGALITCDRVAYEAAWALQQALVARRIADAWPDTLMVLEHDPVFTIGRSGRPEHWGCDEKRLIDEGFPVYHVERGGSITYHGPGQVIGYPILSLARVCSGPKEYMRRLEEVVIRTLREWGIKGRRIEKLTGVWVGDQDPSKISAMGVKIQKGVTMHGFALNVTVDLRPFRHIMPCGISGCRVTSMAEVLGSAPDITAVRQRLTDIFADVFDLEWYTMDQELVSEGLVAHVDRET
ncbi:lipoyl(octanoyl) transferase LipB [Candidatus Nitrospira bockiana]